MAGIASGVLSEEFGRSEVAEGLVRPDGVVGVLQLEGMTFETMAVQGRS